MKMYSSIDEHIGSFSKDKQKTLSSIRKTVKEVCPEATETIRYGIPTFQLNGKNMVHFAGYEEHIGFYPSPNGMKEFEKELKPYASGKGTAKFPWNSPLPLDLIKRIVRFRAEEIKSKK